MRPGQNRRVRGRNRNKGPNPMTRSYESNGPDVKIRGTAQHIADKYSQLARDATASGDPVSAENYFQHAEHYYRMIAAAQEQFRQQYGTQRGFDDEGEDGEDDGGGFGYGPGERQNGLYDESMNGGGGYPPAQDFRQERGQPDRAYPDRGSADRNQQPRGDRPERFENRPDPRQDSRQDGRPEPRADHRPNGRYERQDRGQDRNQDRGYDRPAGGERPAYGADRNGERYERQDRPERQERPDRPERADRQDARGHDSRGQDNRGQDNRGQDNRGQDTRGDRNQQRFGRGDQPRRDSEQPRREGARIDRAPRVDAGSFSEDEAGPVASALPAFLTNPSRPAIALDEPERFEPTEGPNGAGDQPMLAIPDEAEAPKRRRGRPRRVSPIEGDQDTGALKVD